MQKKTKVVTLSTLISVAAVIFLFYKVIQDFKGIDPFDIDFGGEE